MSCESGCYEAQVNGCDDIILKAGLAASTAYYLQINKGQNGNVYQRQISTDIDAILTIETSLFPAGYFTGGYFNLKLRKASDYTVQPLTFNAASYECVLLHISNIKVQEGDTSPISTIQ